MTRPRRHWFAFSLRTLFVGVTLVACWLGYSLNWIRERHQFFISRIGPDFSVKESRVAAPGALWLLGEQGVEFMVLENDEKLKTAKRLFPEASISVDAGFQGTGPGF